MSRQHCTACRRAILHGEFAACMVCCSKQAEEYNELLERKNSLVKENYELRNEVTKLKERLKEKP